MNIPPELQWIVDEFHKQGATLLLVTLDPQGGGYASAPMRGTIVYEIEIEAVKTRMLWTMAGSIQEGRFETAIGRQHPLSNERWEQMLKEQPQ